MARPRQDGLLYFSFDTDFFYADKRIKRLHSRYGNDGLIFYIYLLTEIYRNGYYIRWDSESIEDAMDDLNLAEGFIEQVMTFLVSRSLLTKVSTLANPDTILPTQKEGNGRPHCESADSGDGLKRAEAITSPGIQKRYQEAKKGCKRQIVVDAEIWLLSEEETASCIKVMKNESFSEKNPDNSEKNKSNSEKNLIKESKVKKRKEKQRESVSRFEDFASAYPKDCSRYLTETAYIDLVFNEVETEDNLVECARNYAESCKIQGTQERYIKNAENFLKEFVFEKYLPGKYKKPENDKPKRKSSNFHGREYDFDDLEKELLNSDRGSSG